MSIDSDYLIEISSPAHAYAGADAARIRQIAAKLARLEAVVELAGNLLDDIEIDGTIIHSDRCGCSMCQAIAGLRGAFSASERSEKQC